MDVDKATAAALLARLLRHHMGGDLYNVTPRIAFWVADMTSAFSVGFVAALSHGTHVHASASTRLQRGILDGNLANNLVGSNEDLVKLVLVFM